MPIDMSFKFKGHSLVRDVFIETGTFRGDTAAAGKAAGFEEVHTIEAGRDLYEAARDRFAGDPGVHVHFGASPDVLKTVIDPARSTTFYLDGHFSGNNETVCDSKYGQCPLITELQVITGYQWKEPPIIVIDDSQMFRRPWNEDLLRRFDIDQWPTTREVVRFLRGRFVVETEYEIYAL